MRYLLSAAVMALCGGVLNAATINVPADQPTIQAGIEVAVDYDTVLVAPGTYTENVYDSLSGNGYNYIYILSSGGREVTSVIPDSGTAFYGGFGPHWVIDGFSIRIGAQTGYAIHSHQTIAVLNCDIGFMTTAVFFKEAKKSPAFPAGQPSIDPEWPEPGVRGCRLHNTENAITSGYGVLRGVSDNLLEYNGSGIRKREGSVHVRDCVFRENGYGILHWGDPGSGGDSVIENQFIQNGTAYESDRIYTGGYVLGNVFVDNATAIRDRVGSTLRHNVIYGSTEYAIHQTSLANHAGDYSNNTIVGNARGIVIESDEISPVTANIIVGNQEGIVPGNAVLDCNDVWNNDAYNEPGPNGISVDPLFCGEENADYRIDTASQCALANNNCGVLMGALEAGCTNVWISLSKDTIYAFEANSVTPQSLSIFIGRFADGYVAGDIAPLSVLVNTVIAPDSSIVVASFPEVDGEVLRLDISLREFIHSYGILWGLSTREYTVTATFSDGEAFIAMGEVVFVGHLPGDLNDDNIVDVTDLVLMIDFMFSGGPVPNPSFVADIDGSCTVDISDLVYLVDYMFTGGPAPMVGCE